MPKKRVLVIANKWWECDPIMHVLLNDGARPASALGWPDLPGHPRRRPAQKKRPSKVRSPICRAIFTLSKIKVEVWCISDLLEHLPKEDRYQSSAQRKIERLPKIFAGTTADFVVAIGTAAFPGDVSENGNVVIGTRVFMHDAYPNGTNPGSKWRGGPFDKILTSSLDRPAFVEITSLNQCALNRFLVPPLNAATQGSLLADYSYVALGTINVTDVKEYAQADRLTLDAYLTKYKRVDAKSLETTHGLIRVQSEAPFLFISGIANRMGRFDDDVKPRLYAQNTTAAHNAGIVLGQMIPKINSLF
jgi:hypothetical protein